jgi:hypothetical protein
MPAPTTVWAVELVPGTPPTDVRGTLSLETDALVFTPREQTVPPRRLPLATVAKVHRVIGSPILMIVRDEGGVPARTAFYFVQPPPLKAPEAPPRPGFLGFQRNVERKARRQNLGYFGAWNKEKKAVVREWERSVRSAVAGSR